MGKVTKKSVDRWQYYLTENGNPFRGYHDIHLATEALYAIKDFAQNNGLEVRCGTCEDNCFGCFHINGKTYKVVKRLVNYTVVQCKA